MGLVEALVVERSGNYVCQKHGLTLLQTFDPNCSTKDFKMSCQKHGLKEDCEALWKGTDTTGGCRVPEIMAPE